MITIVLPPTRTNNDLNDDRSFVAPAISEIQQADVKNMILLLLPISQVGHCAYDTY